MYGQFLSDESPIARLERESYWDRLEAARDGTPHYSPRVAAKRRSRELFESTLNKEDLACFDQHKVFFVIGGVTDHLYRIENYHSFNIFDLATGARYCAGPEGVPPYDRLVGQKLWLESDGELEFLGKANVR